MPKIEQLSSVHSRRGVNWLLLELTVPPRGSLGPSLSNKSLVDGHQRDVSGMGLLVVFPTKTRCRDSPVIPRIQIVIPIPAKQYTSGTR